MRQLSLLTRLLAYLLAKRPEVMKLEMIVAIDKKPDTPQDCSPDPDVDDLYDIPDLNHLDDDKHLDNCRAYLSHLYRAPAAGHDTSGGPGSAA